MRLFGVVWGFFVYTDGMGKWLHRMSSIDVKNMTGICINCGPVEVVARTLHGDTVRYACKIGIVEQRNTPNRVTNRGKYTIGNHGLTQEEARKRREEVGCCEICGVTVELAIDHCHTRNKLRGVLCRNHNLGLGYFKDSIPDLLAAVAYLNKYGQE